MPLPPSAKSSTETSGSLFDLDLLVTLEGEGPQPAPPYELMLAHARFLIDPGLVDERQPNPEPFVFD